ncbi:hypothetical protein HPB47_005102 [Ixodes persulcatus]|uniref:Uncharacterized protein n=1 Tax=Ixodes persulcatus TaxID=34615 RepID=A0AC60PDX2_IXOPE|nr:hypothetical protein HPB47_005102 [Ixodes persulcatus]
MYDETVRSDVRSGDTTVGVPRRHQASGCMAEDKQLEEGGGGGAYGGCEGPEAMYVKLISSDGHEFIIKRNHALTSGTIKAMLSGPVPRRHQASGCMAEDKQLEEGGGGGAYGGCEGPEAMYVKLISSDGHEFIIKRNHALTSGTIKAMLSGPGQFAENETNEVNFREIPSHVLQKVCQYFTYKVRYTNSSTEIPEFPIAPEIALELLMAANFLDC